MEDTTMENLVQGNYSGTRVDTTIENLVQGNYSGASGRTPPWRTWYKVAIVEPQGRYHHAE